MFKLFLLLFVSFLPCTWQIADDSIYINVYYEALCPRTREFFITQLSPALLAFPNLIQYRIIPFGEAEAKWNYNTNKFDFDCDIGSEDCIGNRIHNCLIYMMPSFKQHFPFINCTMVNQRVSRLQQMTECAKQFPNIPLDDVMKCANSTMGSQLLWGAGAETLNLIPKLLRTPWILANNIRTSQNQQAIQFDYFNWLCTQLTTEIYEPSICKYGQGWSIENPPGGYPLSGMLNFTLAETGYWNL